MTKPSEENRLLVTERAHAMHAECQASPASCQGLDGPDSEVRTSASGCSPRRERYGAFPRSDEELRTISNRLHGFRDGFTEGHRAGELDERGWVTAFLRRAEFEGRFEDVAKQIEHGAYRVRMRGGS